MVGGRVKSVKVQYKVQPINLVIVLRLVGRRGKTTKALSPLQLEKRPGRQVKVIQQSPSATRPGATCKVALPLLLEALLVTPAKP